MSIPRVGILMGVTAGAAAVVVLLAGFVPASVEAASAAVGCATLAAEAAVAVSGADADAGTAVLSAFVAGVLATAIPLCEEVTVFGLMLVEHAAKPAPASTHSAKAFNAARII